MKGSRLNIFGYLDHKQWLKDTHLQFKKERKPWSYHLFSEELGFGHTNYLHQIITGCRPLTVKSASRIATKLGLTRTEKNYLKKLLDFDQATNSRDKESALEALLELRSAQLVSGLDRDRHRYLSEWYHPIIREMVCLDSFKPDPEWIAAMLGGKVTVDQAAHSFELLQRMGYIRFEAKQNKWIQTESVIELPGELASDAILRYHQQTLGLASDALMSVDQERREISSLTMAISQESFDKLKKSMQQWMQVALSELSETKDPSQIVQLNMQLFPLVEDPAADSGSTQEKQQKNKQKQSAKSKQQDEQQTKSGDKVG